MIRLLRDCFQGEARFAPTGVVVLIIILGAFSVIAQDDDDTVISPPENIFGLVEGVWYPELTCDLNPGWERLIFDWSAHQPNGPDEWVGFLNIDDRWLQSASDCNREVVAVVKNTPAWATDGIPGAGVPRGLYLPIDDPANVWANFMRQMGAYYASRGVQRFIIWNEPDIAADTYGFEFEGTLEDYFMLVKVAYLAVKEGNPAASIHLAGTTYWHDVNSGDRLYTDRLLERIAQDPDGAQHDYYFNALSLHIYFRSETVYDIVTVYRDLLDQHGFDDKAVWITETNASPNLDPNWPVVRPQFQITLEQQAAFLLHSAALGLAAGAERIALYKLFDQQLPEGGESFGVLYPADSTPRPAFYSWQTVIKHFNGVSMAQRFRTDEVNVVQLMHHAGHQTAVMWARTEHSVELEIAAISDKAYLVDQYGREQIIRPQEGVYVMMLPGATCEDEAGEGCVVGGDVSLLIQPMGETTFTQITLGGRVVLVQE